MVKMTVFTFNKAASLCFSISFSYKKQRRDQDFLSTLTINNTYKQLYVYLITWNLRFDGSHMFSNKL